MDQILDYKLFQEAYDEDEKKGEERDNENHERDEVREEANRRVLRDTRVVLGHLVEPSRRGS